MSKDLSERVLEYLPPASPRRLRRSVAGDIESEGLRGSYLVGATMPDNGPIQIHYTPEAMLASFLTHRYRNWELLLHNAEYDMWYLLPSLVELVKGGGWEVKLWVTKNLRIVHALIRHGGTQWHIRDTWSVLPLPLAELEPLARLPKMDIGFQQGTIFDIDTLAHREYLERDVQITLLAYRAYQMAIMKHFQVLPGYTAGSTALRAMRRSFDVGEQYFRQSAEIEAFCRKAYYGGYVYLPSTEPAHNIAKIDVNAMYAAAMRYPMPYGTGCYTRIEIPDAMGIYRCLMECPAERGIPPIVPVPGNNGPWYPTWGKHECYLPSNTIAYARKVGYQISIVDGYYFGKQVQPFNRFLDKCEQLEKMYKRQGLKLIIKSLRNSLYGKFAQSGEVREYIITDEPTIEMTPAHGLGGVEVPNLFFMERDFQAGHMQPAWACFITAQARIILHRAMRRIGIKYLHYADTDAIFADQQAIDSAIMVGAIPMGELYGEWKLEAEYVYFAPFNPKTYIGIKNDGSYDARHKGVPVWDSELEDMLALADGSIAEIVRYFMTYHKALATVGVESREERRYTITPDVEDDWGID